MFDFIGSKAQHCLTSSTIIFNTFDELEQEVLESIAAKFPNFYTVGPLTSLGRQVLDESNLIKSLSLSLWQEDTKYLEWLDEQKPNPVVYVNYGSITSMTEQHLKEFVWGLANSN